jgi:predicted nucleic acid-binding protein
VIVLDTNVVSEMMRLEPARIVELWFESQPMASLYTTVITQAEILYGLAKMAPGRRRSALERESGICLKRISRVASWYLMAPPRSTTRRS